jgi:hypothetical protein
MVLGFICPVVYVLCKTLPILQRSDWKQLRRALGAVLLAPLNLHVLYIGSLYSLDLASGDEEAAADSYFFFVACKVLETGLESVPLSLLTAAAIVRPAGAIGGSSASDAPAERLLLISSLVLSTLSMAYGFLTRAYQLVRSLRPLCTARPTACAPSLCCALWRPALPAEMRILGALLRMSRSQSLITIKKGGGSRQPWAFTDSRARAKRQSRSSRCG